MSIEEWVREEQGHLWYELKQVLDEAINHTWSIAAAQVIRRIIGAARLVGPNESGTVPWALVAGGVYDAVLKAGDIRFEKAAPAVFARWDAMMTKQANITAETYVERYKATVESIGFEAAWLVDV